MDVYITTKPLTMAGVYATLTEQQKQKLYHITGVILDTGVVPVEELNELKCSLNTCDQVTFVKAIISEANRIIDERLKEEKNG